MGLNIDFNQVKANLMAIQKNIRNNVIDKSLDAGAEIILEEELKNVPVHVPDKKNRKSGGRLKASLGVGKKSGTELKRSVHIGIINAHEREVVYGYYQEYGFQRGGKAVAGKKWMKKSFNNSVKKANEKIKDVVIKEITAGVKK
ncbi:HK97 gp10 family phage protein [Paraclostridium sordellii]|uniref:HK97 gp10 family phage protein n=1 Tax=Paraclostridium sordellii TaxID=1505 RepID=UPI0002F04D88|nr:HK97 gp10 family phage protein [Paeniclostridium sordellii]